MSPRACSNLKGAYGPVWSHDPPKTRRPRTGFSRSPVAPAGWPGAPNARCRHVRRSRSISCADLEELRDRFNKAAFDFPDVDAVVVKLPDIRHEETVRQARECLGPLMHARLNKPGEPESFTVKEVIESAGCLHGLTDGQCSWTLDPASPRINRTTRRTKCTMFIPIASLSGRPRGSRPSATSGIALSSAFQFVVIHKRSSFVPHARR